MTEKRYTISFDKYTKNSLILENNEFFCRIHHIDKNKIIDRLNKQEELINTLREELELADKENTSLAEENEQLKQAYQTLKHRHSLLHDECLEAECDRDRYHKDVVSLEKENERLKQQNESLKDTNESLTAQLAHGIEDLMGDD